MAPPPKLFTKMGVFAMAIAMAMSMAILTPMIMKIKLQNLLILSNLDGFLSLVHFGQVSRNLKIHKDFEFMKS